MEMGFSLGSNIGDRQDWLRLARAAILSYPDVTEIASSSFFETSPVDVKEEYQDQLFLNAVVVISSSDAPSVWLERLTQIESDLKRVRTKDKNAPRTIDVDLLYAGDKCIDSGGLIVPHPRWSKRKFVVAPLAEVRPDLVLPSQTKSVAALLCDLDSDEIITQLETTW